jgi:hypothetical protein
VETLYFSISITIGKVKNMFSFRLSSFIIIFSLCVPFLSAQNSNSIQFTGGILSPMASEKGLTGFVQYNYQAAPDIYIYLYSGYSSWDKDKVRIKRDRATLEEDQFFRTYTEDNHTLIPVYLGSKINFRTTKLFTTYFNFEAGYAYLNYNKYNVLKSVNPEGVVLGYFPDGSSKKEITEHLLGVGIGAGLSHPMTKSVNLLFAFHLNSYINSDYYDFMSTQGTYTSFTFGFDFNI